MSRSKSKIAVTLLGALAFGANAQAMNSGVKDVKPEQSIGAVRGARIQPKKINWNKIVKIVGFSVAGLAALETIHSIIGGFTDSEFGSLSIGRAIRNRVKNNQKPNNQDDSGQEIINNEKNSDEKNSDEESNNEESTENVNNQNIVNQIQNGNNEFESGEEVVFNEEEENVLSFFNNVTEDEKIMIINTYRKIKNGEYKYNECTKGSFYLEVANAVLDFFKNIKEYSRNNFQIHGPQDGKISYLINESYKFTIIVRTKERPSVNVTAFYTKGSKFVDFFCDQKKLLDFK